VLLVSTEYRVPKGTGEFEKGHLYEGFLYVAIKDKSQKLNIYNSYIRDTSDLMRIPIFDNSDLSNDLGGAIICLVNLVKKAKNNKKGRFYLKPDKTGTFFTGRPHCKNYITKILKIAAKILGIPPENLSRGHTF
jgi:hypothetical protein